MQFGILGVDREHAPALLCGQPRTPPGGPVEVWETDRVTQQRGQPFFGRVETLEGEQVVHGDEAPGIPDEFALPAEVVALAEHPTPNIGGYQRIGQLSARLVGLQETVGEFGIGRVLAAPLEVVKRERNRSTGSRTTAAVWTRATDIG